jgi:hypothetical protein
MRRRGLFGCILPPFDAGRTLLYSFSLMIPSCLQAVPLSHLFLRIVVHSLIPMTSQSSNTKMQQQELQGKESISIPCQGRSSVRRSCLRRYASCRGVWVMGDKVKFGVSLALTKDEQPSGVSLDRVNFTNCVLEMTKRA